jgi:hypothetical protein
MKLLTSDFDGIVLNKGRFVGEGGQVHANAAAIFATKHPRLHISSNYYQNKTRCETLYPSGLLSHEIFDSFSRHH